MPTPTDNGGPYSPASIASLGVCDPPPAPAFPPEWPVVLADAVLEVWRLREQERAERLRRTEDQKRRLEELVALVAGAELLPFVDFSWEGWSHAVKGVKTVTLELPGCAPVWMGFRKANEEDADSDQAAGWVQARLTVRGGTNWFRGGPTDHDEGFASLGRAVLDAWETCQSWQRPDRPCPPAKDEDIPF